MGLLRVLCIDERVKMRELFCFLENERKVSIIESLYHNWKEVGQLLGFSDSDINTLMETYNGNAKKCCIEVFYKWLNESSTDTRPRTWNTLLNELRSRECFHEVVSAIEAILLDSSQNNQSSCALFKERPTIIPIAIMIVFMILLFNVNQIPVPESCPSQLSLQSNESIQYPTKRETLEMYLKDLNSHYCNEDVRQISVLNDNTNALYVPPVFIEINMNDMGRLQKEVGNQLYILEDWFRYDHTGQRILIQGVPGSGKTTLTHVLIKQWANNTGEISKWRILVKANLGRFNGNPNITLVDLLSLNGQINITEDLKQSIINNATNISFLLDGLDEYPPGYNDASGFVYKLITGKELELSTVIVTGRPEAFSSFHSSISNLKNFEITGFNSSGIEMFITELYHHNVTKSRQLISYLNSTTELMDMCHTPMLLTMLLSVIEQHHPLTMTELYVHYISIYLRREFKKRSLTKYEKKNECQTFVVDNLKSLQSCDQSLADAVMGASELAYRSCYRTIFFEADIEGVLPCQNYGLVYSHKVKGFKNPTIVYSFIHFSIQEFFFALNKVFRNEGSMNDLYLNELRLKFYCGLCSDISSLNEIQYINDNIDNPTIAMFYYSVCTSDLRQGFFRKEFSHKFGFKIDFDYYLPLNARKVYPYVHSLFQKLSHKFTHIKLKFNSPLLSLLADTCNLSLFPNIGVVELSSKKSMTIVAKSNFELFFKEKNVNTLSLFHINWNDLCDQDFVELLAKTMKNITTLSLEIKNDFNSSNLYSFTVLEQFISYFPSLKLLNLTLSVYWEVKDTYVQYWSFLTSLKSSPVSKYLHKIVIPFIDTDWIQALISPWNVDPIHDYLCSCKQYWYIWKATSPNLVLPDCTDQHVSISTFVNSLLCACDQLVEIKISRNLFNFFVTRTISNNTSFDIQTLMDSCSNFPLVIHTVSIQLFQLDYIAEGSMAHLYSYRLKYHIDSDHSEIYYPMRLIHLLNSSQSLAIEIWNNNILHLIGDGRVCRNLKHLTVNIPTTTTSVQCIQNCVSNASLLSVKFGHWMWNHNFSLFQNLESLQIMSHDINKSFLKHDIHDLLLNIPSINSIVLLMDDRSFNPNLLLKSLQYKASGLAVTSTTNFDLNLQYHDKLKQYTILFGRVCYVDSFLFPLLFFFAISLNK